MELELLASGYGLIEGPRVDADDNLYFSDVPNGGVYRRSPDGQIDVVIPKRRGVGGIALHEDGGLVVSGRNICHVADGQSRIVHDDPSVAGWNDIFTDVNGRILAGCLRSNPFDLDQGERERGELVRIGLDGDATVLYGDVGVTNGIGFSPDGGTLYHSDTDIPGVIVHDVIGDSVANRRHLPVPDLPDGLAVDTAGGIWVACYGGGRVQRLLPDGSEDVAVGVPSRAVTSCCFGWNDPHELYIVTADHSEDPSLGGCIYRTHLEFAGIRAPLARV